MPFSVSLREADKLVVGKVDDTFELGMALEFADAVRRAAVANRFDVLVDMRAGYRMKFFADEAEAMHWLAQQRTIRASTR